MTIENESGKNHVSRWAMPDGLKRLGLLGGLSLAVAVGGMLAGCEGQVIDPSPSASAGDSEELVAVAELNFPSGQKLEFFDLGDGAMISETGPARMPQMWTGGGKMEPDDLLNVWNKFSPKEAPPQALRTLHERLKNAPPRSATARKPPQFETLQTPAEPVSSELGDGLVAAPRGCNNGCCDHEWLSTFIECSQTGDLYWFYENAGKSSGKGNDAFHFRAMACAAIGPSTYRTHIEGKKDKTTVLQEGYYRTVGAIGGLFDDPNVGSYVNESGPMNSHAHCGIIYF